MTREQDPWGASGAVLGLRSSVRIHPCTFHTHRCCRYCIQDKGPYLRTNSWVFKIAVLLREVLVHLCFVNSRKKQKAGGCSSTPHKPDRCLLLSTFHHGNYGFINWVRQLPDSGLAASPAPFFRLHTWERDPALPCEPSGVWP